MNRIGFFYPVYKQPRATRHVLENVRKYYPDSPIVMVSDGGNDFSELASEFCCLYSNEEQLGNGRGTIMETSEKLGAWLLRLANAMNYTQSRGCGWTLLLEDDVLLKGRFVVPTDTIFLSIAGPPWEQPWNPHVTQLRDWLIENYPATKPNLTTYGGQGGSLFYNERCGPAILGFACSSQFRSLFNKFSGALSWSDIAISTALALAQIFYTVSPFHGNGKGALGSSDILVVHPYKEMYVSE